MPSFNIHFSRLTISSTEKIGSNVTGKEKVFLGILEELGCKLWAQPQKRDVFHCIGNQTILSALTAKSTEAKIHVLPMNHLRFDVSINCKNEYMSTTRKSVATNKFYFFRGLWSMYWISPECSVTFSHLNLPVGKWVVNRGRIGSILLQKPISPFLVIIILNKFRYNHRHELMSVGAA